METEDMEWAPGLDTMSDGDSDSSQAASDADTSDSDSQVHISSTTVLSCTADAAHVHGSQVQCPTRSLSLIR